MADGDFFMVELAELNAAIDGVSAERDAIQAQITRVRATFDDVEAHWKSPSGTSFAALVPQFNSLAAGLGPSWTRQSTGCEPRPPTTPTPRRSTQATTVRASRNSLYRGLLCG